MRSYRTLREFIPEKVAEKQNDPRTRRRLSTLSRENLPRLERTGNTNDTTVASGTTRLGNIDRSRDQPSRLSGKVNPGEISEDNNYRLPPSRLSMYSSTDDGTKPPTGDRDKPSRAILGRRPGRESITPRDSDSNLENGVSDRSVKPGEHSPEGSREGQTKTNPEENRKPFQVSTGYPKIQRRRPLFGNTENPERDVGRCARCRNTAHRSTESGNGSDERMRGRKWISDPEVART